MGIFERLEKAIEERLEPIGDHPYEYALALWRLLVAHPKPGGFCPNRLSAPAAVDLAELDSHIAERGFVLARPLCWVSGPLGVGYGGAAESRVLVVVRSGPSAGKVGLGEERLIIGRGEDVDLRLGDPSVSRRHCSLNARLELVDLSSRLGVTVRGQRVSEVTLEDGGRFSLGSQDLQAFKV